MYNEHMHDIRQIVKGGGTKGLQLMNPCEITDCKVGSSHCETECPRHAGMDMKANLVYCWKPKSRNPSLGQPRQGIPSPHRV